MAEQNVFVVAVSLRVCHMFAMANQIPVHRMRAITHAEHALNAFAIERPKHIYVLGIPPARLVHEIEWRAGVCGAAVHRVEACDVVEATWTA